MTIRPPTHSTPPAPGLLPTQLINSQALSPLGTLKFLQAFLANAESTLVARVIAIMENIPSSQGGMTKYSSAQHPLAEQNSHPQTSSKLNGSKEWRMLLELIPTPSSLAPRQSESSPLLLQVVSDKAWTTGQLMTLQLKQLAGDSHWQLIASTEKKVQPPRITSITATEQTLRRLQMDMPHSYTRLLHTLERFQDTFPNRSISVPTISAPSISDQLMQRLKEIPSTVEIAENPRLLQKIIREQSLANNSQAENSLPSSVPILLKQLIRSLIQDPMANQTRDPEAPSIPTNPELAWQAASDIKIRLHQQSVADQLLSLARNIKDFISLQQLHNALQAAEAPDLTGRQQEAPPTAERRQNFCLDIPIRHGDHFSHVQLSVERDSPEKRSSKNRKNSCITRWCVRLEFDLPRCGQVQAQATLRDTRLDAHFWAAEQTTQEKIQQALKGFQQQLQRQGLEVETLQCHGGKMSGKAGLQSHAFINTRS